jgi:nicotinamide mononucleotide transporter
MSWVEIIAVAVTAFGVWLMARRSLWCWPVNIAGVAIYGWIFFGAKLYSDMLLQGFYLGANIFGWFQWKGGSAEGDTVTVVKPSAREMSIGIALAAAGAVVLGSLMARYTNASAPWIDSTLTSYSLLAQVWAARRFIENWWLWITLDVFYMPLFIYKQLYSTSGLYLMMMMLCVYGLYDWRRAARA